MSSIWAFWDLNEIMTPNHFYGSGMAVFMEIEHGLRVVSLYVSNIMVKVAILAVQWAQFLAFLDHNKIMTPKLLSRKWNGRVYVGRAWFQ